MPMVARVLGCHWLCQCKCGVHAQRYHGSPASLALRDPALSSSSCPKNESPIVVGCLLADSAICKFATGLTGFWPPFSIGDGVTRLTFGGGSAPSTSGLYFKVGPTCRRTDKPGSMLGGHCVPKLRRKHDILADRAILLWQENLLQPRSSVMFTSAW